MFPTLEKSSKMVENFTESNFLSTNHVGRTVVSCFFARGVSRYTVLRKYPCNFLQSRAVILPVFLP